MITNHTGGQMYGIDWFCCAGGSTVGYERAGIPIAFGVDIDDGWSYPGELVVADAIDLFERMLDGYRVPLANFENGFGIEQAVFMHASCPCQFFSSKTPDPSKHLDLITPFRPLLEEWSSRSGGVWIIENVVGARKALRDPIQLCGSSFGLRVRRHRLFESNIELVAPKCDHRWQNEDKRYRLYDHGRWYDSGIVHVFGTGGGKGREHWADAMRIDWMTDEELAEALPPDFTEFLGLQVRAHLLTTNRPKEA